MSDLITVVIPIYNVEQYVGKCLDSLLNQTYSDIELICVDDGSTDDSSNILDIYADKDSRIKAIHKKNEGVSIARNYGIELAKGKYIAFVDSDDFVADNYIECLVHEMNENNVDLIVCGHIRVKSDKQTLVFGYKDGIYYSGTKVFYRYLSSCLEACYPWNKLFRTDIIQKNAIMFETGIHPGEDLLFVMHYIKYIRTARFINKFLYYYVDSSSSVMNRNRGKSVYTNYLKQENPVRKLIEDSDGLYRESCLVRLYGVLVCMYYNLIIYHEGVSTEDLKAEISKIQSIVLESKVLSVKTKVKYLLMRYFPAFYRKITNI